MYNLRKKLMNAGIVITMTFGLLGAGHAMESIIHLKGKLIKEEKYVIKPSVLIPFEHWITNKWLENNIHVQESSFSEYGYPTSKYVTQKLPNGCIVREKYDLNDKGKLEVTEREMVNPNKDAEVWLKIWKQLPDGSIQEREYVDVNQYTDSLSKNNYSERIKKFKSLQGQITSIHSNIQKIGHLKQNFLEKITLELKNGTYAHCWLPINSEYLWDDLKKEYGKDISEKSPDLETAIVIELNEQNINRSKAFINDRDWVLGNYTISDALSNSDSTRKWLQGKHYLIKELYINKKTFKFE